MPTSRGVSLSWITPACLYEKELKSQRELIRPLADFVKYCSRTDPQGVVFTMSLAETPQRILHELKRGHSFILARKNGQLAGALLFSQQSSQNYHTQFTLVDPSLRRQNIARDLTFALIRFIRQSGGGTIERVLAQPASQIWHQKWAQKPARLRLGSENHRKPVEEIEFLPREDYPTARIHVFPPERHIKVHKTPRVKRPLKRPVK